MDTVILLFIQS